MVYIHSSRAESTRKSKKIRPTQIIWDVIKHSWVLTQGWTLWSLSRAVFHLRLWHHSLHLLSTALLLWVCHPPRLPASTRYPQGGNFGSASASIWPQVPSTASIPIYLKYCKTVEKNCIIMAYSVPNKRCISCKLHCLRLWEGSNHMSKWRATNMAECLTQTSSIGVSSHRENVVLLCTVVVGVISLVQDTMKEH